MTTTTSAETAVQTPQATLGGADSAASMPPIPPALQPLAPAASVVLLTGLALLLGAAATRTTVRRDVT